MILPGDLLWDRYRVTSIEPESAGRAWLSDTSAPNAPPILFFELAAPGAGPLGIFLSRLGRALLKRTGAPETLAYDFIGNAEVRGAPESEGAVLLAPAARESLNDQLKRDGAATPGEAADILRRLLNAIHQLTSTWNRRSEAPALNAALAKLLNPISLGFAPDGAKRLGLCAAAANVSAEFAPPLWAHFAAPEILRGEEASERALVYGVGQIARALLLGSQAIDGAWTQFAQDVLGKRDAAKDFLGETASLKLPEALRAVVAKCLKSKPAGRFPSLLKLRGALTEGAEGLLFEAKAPAGTRTAAASALAPSRMPPPGMVIVEAGAFQSGEKKLSRTLRAFAIDTTPVTEKVYKQFLKETQRTVRPSGPGSRAAKFDDHPVVNATWREASDFAEHHGKRLPTIYEWEKAARGTDGRKFPYGDSYLPGTGRLRVPSTGANKESLRNTAAAGSYPLGGSPYGVLDMAGNVLEWTNTGRRQGKRMFRALKGACFLDGSPELSRCTGMQYKAADASETCIGFRCVKDLD